MRSVTERARYRTVVSDNIRWEGFELRSDDIVISTPAKSGTTWTQMICALLVFQTADLPAPLDLLSPWLDMQTRDRAAVNASLAAQTHRRFIKSHTPYDGLPHDDRVTYICVGRDPRDVARSWDNHMANTDLVALMTARDSAVGNEDLAELLPDGPPVPAATEIERFWEWADAPVAGGPRGESLANLVHHMSTFWAVREQPNILLLHYDDLKADLDGQMRRVSAQLGIPVDEERWPALVEAATFERMRANADRVAPDTTNRIWQDNREFFHRGTSGQWGALLDAAGLDRYLARVAALAPDDLARWLHRDLAHA
jgi:aryl sulfotransferase